MNKHQTTKIRRKTRSPLHAGVANTSLTMQMEATECGAACLTMILSYYGKWIPLEQIRADCGVSRDGANAKNVVLAARRYALEADGYRYNLERLQKEAVFPCIIYWNYNHFIVLNGFRGKRAYLSDPAKGKYTLTMDEFEAGYSGVCLIMKPGPATWKEPSACEPSVWQEASAFPKCIFGNVRHARRNRHRHQPLATGKRPIANAFNRQPVYDIGDN